MRSMSYMDFLGNTAGAGDAVMLLLRDSIKGLWGFGRELKIHPYE